MKKKTKKLCLSKDTIASLTMRAVFAAEASDSTKPVCTGSEGPACTVVDTTGMYVV